MNKYVLGLLLCLCLIGCGGGGGDSTPVAPTHTPGISNLIFSPSSANLNQGGGAITVTGYVDFIDSGGDLSTITIVGYDLQGIANSAKTIDLQNVNGLKSGTVFIAAIVSTNVAGDHPFGVYVTDAAGLNSNTLRGTFPVQ